MAGNRHALSKHSASFSWPFHRLSSKVLYAHKKHALTLLSESPSSMTPAWKAWFESHSPQWQNNARMLACAFGICGFPNEQTGKNLWDHFHQRCTMRLQCGCWRFRFCVLPKKQAFRHARDGCKHLPCTASICYFSRLVYGRWSQASTKHPHHC